MDTSTPESGTKSEIPADQFASLHRQRTVLERIFKVTAAVERLHTGLRCALEMGDPPRRISDKARDFLAKLDGETLTQPNEKLKDSLVRLDREVNDHLGEMVALADIDPQALEEAAVATESDGQSGSQQGMGLLKEFSRKAQTSAAIRVLLHERGVSVKPVVVGLPTARLKTRIKELKRREGACRERAKKSILGMQRDLQNLLKTPGFPAGIVNMLQETRRGLGQNLRHLERGGSMDDLPAPMELINVAADAKSTSPPRADDADPEQSEPQSPPGEQVEIRPMGFFKKLWWWFNTPYSVGWRDIEQYASTIRNDMDQPHLK